MIFRLLPVLLVLVVLGGSAAAAGSRTAVPSDFRPLSFTAVSEQDFWLLGTVPCQGRRCTAILRTTNGGRRFTALKAPQLPSSGATAALRFADHRDGFLFVPRSGLFFATHDGGATWKRLDLGPILGFASGGGRVFVVTPGRFGYAPVSGNGWTLRPLPFASDGSTLDLEAHGAKLWLLGTRRGAPSSHDVLARSLNAGRTFVTGAGPCVPGLGGSVAPTFGNVVWAVCPTGTLAGAWRSTNGGIRFAGLRTPQLVNSAQLAPASATTAVLARGGNTRLLRTTDGGRTWSAPSTPGRFTDVLFLGFTAPRVGVALLRTAGTTSVMWRTTDAGATWSRVRLG